MRAQVFSGRFLSSDNHTLPKYAPSVILFLLVFKFKIVYYHRLHHPIIIIITYISHLETILLKHILV